MQKIFIYDKGKNKIVVFIKPVDGPQPEIYQVFIYEISEVVVC